jgi:2-aminoethylphosphonate-pyruvate transaminase
MLLQEQNNPPIINNISPRLFTPGPLSTSDSVRAAANADVGSRTTTAIALTARLRSEISAIADCGESYTVIPLQGSGTFAVEAMLGSMLAEQDHVLIIENGTYSARMTEICLINDIRRSTLKANHYASFNLGDIEARLIELGDVTHIAAVHFETALGVLNDVDGLSKLALRYGCGLFVDAISTFGALPLDFDCGVLAAVALSANKCLHGLPGIAFVIVDKRGLTRLKKPRTLSLNLLAQYRALESDGQWRFTPPLQAMLALEQAIKEFRVAGGRTARYQHYAALAERLVKGMDELDIVPVIEAPYRAPIITTFVPRDGRIINTVALNEFLFRRGLVIYPTKYWNSASFRVAVIGDLDMNDINNLLNAFSDFLKTTAASVKVETTALP